MANIVTHPWTHAIQFDGADVPGLISIEGFRTLLENTYELRLGKAKRPSYIRNRAWLDAIANRDERPPVGYTTNVASWKHEIGYTKRETAKWVCQNGQVFNKKGKNTAAPHTASEDLYILMTNVHRFHGHMGRDNFYNAVQKLSATPTKDFCNSFINSCCSKASMWIDGGLVNPHQLPVAVAKPAGANAHVRPPMDAPVDNPPRNDNGVPFGNGVAFDNEILLNNWIPLDNAVVPEGMGPVYDPAPANVWHNANNMGEIDDGMNAMIGGGMGVDFAVPVPNWHLAAPVPEGQQIAYFPEMQYMPLPADVPVQSQADHSYLDQFFAPDPAADQPICRGRSHVNAVEQSMEPSPDRGQGAQTGLLGDFNEYLEQIISENLPFGKGQDQDMVAVDTPSVDPSQGREIWSFVQNQDVDQAMEDFPVDNSQALGPFIANDLPVAGDYSPDMAVEADQPDSLPVEKTESLDFDMSEFLMNFDGEIDWEVDVNAGEEIRGDIGVEAVEDAGMQAVVEVPVEDFVMQYGMEVVTGYGGELDPDPDVFFGVEGLDWERGMDQ